PIVIKVAHGHAHAEAAALNAGFLRHIGKCAVVVIAIQAVPIAWIIFVGGLAVFLPRMNACAVNEEQVGPAVVVVVDHGDAASHRLDQVLFRRSGVFVVKSYATCGGNVGE